MDTDGRLETPVSGTKGPTIQDISRLGSVSQWLHLPHKFHAGRVKAKESEIKDPKFHDLISLLTVTGRDTVYSFDCTVNSLSHCSGKSTFLSFLFSFSLLYVYILISYVEVRRQLAGVCSLFTPRQTQGLNSVCQAASRFLYPLSHLASPSPSRVTACSSKWHRTRHGDQSGLPLHPKCWE